jgi:hypothetical protein
VLAVDKLTEFGVAGVSTIGKILLIAGLPALQVYTLLYTRHITKSPLRRFEEEIVDVPDAVDVCVWLLKVTAKVSPACNGTSGAWLIVK